MAIPSGYGTEVLQRKFYDGLAAGSTNILTGVANHIYTILSITFQASGSSPYINITMSPDGSGSIKILADQPIPTGQTFVFNDKIVMVGTDIMAIYANVSTDIWLSYIDQNWDSS